ncbi:hypothetical protein KCU98_g196, partial [Aureobasidium melanogenum]
MPRGKDRINNTDAVPIVTLQGCQFCLEHQAEIRRYFWDGTILCQRCSILSYGKDCESVGEKPYSQVSKTSITSDLVPPRSIKPASTVLTRSVPDSAVHGGSSLVRIFPAISWTGFCNLLIDTTPISLSSIRLGASRCWREGRHTRGVGQQTAAGNSQMTPLLSLQLPGWAKDRLARTPRVHILVCIAGLHLEIDEQLIASSPSTRPPLSSCKIRLLLTDTRGCSHHDSRSYLLEYENIAILQLSARRRSRDLIPENLHSSLLAAPTVNNDHYQKNVSRVTGINHSFMSANKGTSSAMFGSPRFCGRQMTLLIVGLERRVGKGAHYLAHLPTQAIPCVLCHILNSAQRQILPSPLRGFSFSCRSIFLF